MGYDWVSGEDEFMENDIGLPCVIASNKSWGNAIRSQLEKQLGRKVFFIRSKEEMNAAFLEEINPEYIFFTHWSDMIPEEIYSRFQCVVFHMTDLPFGRGGSPLQNLIARGVYETKLSAIRCERGLDTGPVYLKRRLSLHGNAEEIYLRSDELAMEMMVDIVSQQLQPFPQQGTATFFHRRMPKDGNAENLESLTKMYDFIRMLDAEGYPRAFIDVGKFHLEFERASRKHGYIHADVRIYLRDEE